MEEKLTNNLAKEALQTLQHFHCFLEQQTQKVRLQDECPSSSLTLAPFPGSSFLCRGEPLLANPAAGACVTQAVVTASTAGAHLQLFCFPIEALNP